MSAPTIEWLRPGVGYTPAAAASMRRLERELGRNHDCNSSYRDYDEQQRMFDAWNRYVNSGYNPRYKPNHSRAIDPDDSMHCKGLADDSDDWATPGYIALAARHGWIRTAAWDPTERHHFEYQEWNDQHRNDPAPAAITEPPKPKEWEDMATKEEIKQAFVEALRETNAENVDKSVTVSINPPDDGSDDQVWYAVDFDAGTMYRLWNGVQLDVRRNLGLRELVNQPPQLLDGIRETTVIP